MIVEEFQIKIEDSYCHVIKFGIGKRTLLILPGVSLCGLEGQGKAIADAYNIFSNDFTCYLIDYRASVHNGFIFEDICEDIYNVCFELNIKHAYVYGVSMGGMAGLYLAQKNDIYIDSLCVCSSMCKISPMMKEVGANWIKLAKAHDVVGLNKYFFERCYSKNYLDSIKELLPELIKKGSYNDCDRFCKLVQCILKFDIKSIIKEINTDVLVLGDINDSVIGPDGSYEIAQTLGCDIYMYNQYSHAVYDECLNIKEKIYNFMMKE